jgi:hypothetical protein
VRQLASARREFQLDGAITLAWSVIVGGVLAATSQRPLRVLVGFAATAAIFGVGMYLAVYGRYVRAALTQAREISNPQRETRAATERRIALRATFGNILTSGALLLVMASGGLGRGFVGIIAGNGAALLALARDTARWERRHSLEVLREPRYRWGSNQGRFGRGVMDPQDFCFVRSSTRPLESTEIEDTQPTATTS